MGGGVGCLRPQQFLFFFYFLYKQLAGRIMARSYVVRRLSRSASRSLPSFFNFFSCSSSSALMLISARLVVASAVIKCLAGKIKKVCVSLIRVRETASILLIHSIRPS